MTRRFGPSVALLAAAVVACQASSPPGPVGPPAATTRTLAVAVIAPDAVLVTGANVCVFTLSGTQERCAETSATGIARLIVRPGAYSVQATAPAPTRLAEGRTYAEVLDADANIVVRLEPHSRINGTVKDEGGATVTDAEICAHPPSVRTPPTCARSGAEGKFSIDVRSDVYRLELNGPPGGRLLSQWATGRLTSGEADIIDVRSADAEGIAVTMVRGVRLTGVVRGPSGPVEDAQVCTKSLAAPLPWDCERTKKNGSYLVLLQPGRYYLWTVPPDNVRLVAQWYDHELEGVDTSEITVDRDREIDVTLDPGPQLRGKVTTVDGLGVAGALVCVDTRFPTGRICRPTAGDGSYAVTTRPQTYTVQVLAPAGSDLINEFWLHKRTWVEANSVTLGTADRLLDLTMRKGVRVTGVIRDKRGVRLEGATINLNDDAGPLVGASTDISGTYSLVVPPGAYQVEVFAPFRGERGDVLSQPPRDLIVAGYTSYDAVLEDASP